nr:putative ribonuclease H-like domain-containing protein [Tanacetum cinerariifolium]
MSKNLEEHGFVIHALKDPSSIEVMQEELLQFKLQEVWTLVNLSNRKRAIGSKSVFRNKKNEMGIMIRNKARLVAQGYTQEERIDYDEVFASVARIKAIRLFLAYALFKDFVVYQIDVESDFLYGKIEEEVYVCQLLGFEDPNFPIRVYKVKKALYGLHQAPRAWYETLSTYLLENGFQREKIDNTLFIKKRKGDILLMSSMGELTFFLGLQVSQKMDGIFINQDKYVVEILKKFRFTKVKTASTLMETQKPLLNDEDGEEVDVHMYRKSKESVRLMIKKLFRMEFELMLPSDPMENVADEAVHKELGDSFMRAAITASSLGAEQDNGNINKTQSKATPNESSSQGTNSGGGPWCQETMSDTIAQTRFESIAKHYNDSLLARVNTHQSDEDRLKFDELMALCTNLQNRILDLEKKNTTQFNEIASLKRRVKKLKKNNRSRIHRRKRLYKVGLSARVESSRGEESLGEDASKQERINAIDADEEITLVNVQDNTDKEMFDVDALNVINTAKLIIDAAQVSADGDIVSTASIPISVVSAVSAVTTVSTAITTTATITTVDDDKGKGILIEPVKPKKRKDQIRLDEEAALKLQAEFNKKERIAKEKAEKE